MTSAVVKHLVATPAIEISASDIRARCLAAKSIRYLVPDAVARLTRSSLRHITEYGRAVHAEMDALIACARMGSAVRGGTLYVTTYPCHNCARRRTLFSWRHTWCVRVVWGRVALGAFGGIVIAAVAVAVAVAVGALFGARFDTKHALVPALCQGVTQCGNKGVKRATASVARVAVAVAVVVARAVVAVVVAADIRIAIG